MKSTASKRTVSNNGNTVTNTSVKVKSRVFGGNVIKTKKVTDEYQTTPKGRVFVGSKTVKTKKKYQ